MDAEKLQHSTTTDGQPPRPGCETAAAPAPLKPNGQHEAYWILSAEERAKGFVRPVRLAYRHVGLPAPQYLLRDLTPEEHRNYDKFGYVKYEEFPVETVEETGCTGRYWKQAELDKIGKGCGAVTRMASGIAETYARQPDYYGATFCCNCGTHLPVGKYGEFVWIDKGQATTERVGT